MTAGGKIEITEQSPMHFQLQTNIADKLMVVNILLDIAKGVAAQLGEKKLIEVPDTQVVLQ